MEQTNNTYEIYYDEGADFLEVFFGEPTACYAEEVEPGVFIRKDEKTNEIKSIGISSFKKRTQILKQVLQKIHLRLPMSINFD